MQSYKVVTIALDNVPSPEWRSLLKGIEIWFANISRNLCCIGFDILPYVALGVNQYYFTPAGGMGAPPRNSQTLIKHVLDCLDATVVQQFEHTEKHLLVIANYAFKSHTWHLHNRGLRYSIVPSNATFGAVAHELGHLLFDWPDLDWEKSLGEDCLMSLGALRYNGTPALPCAPLRVKQGWIDPIVVDQLTTVQDLSIKQIGTINWQRHNVLVEYRVRKETACLLIYSNKYEGKLFHPKIIGRIPVTNSDGRNLVLGLIAPKLRLRYSF
ncbi:MAG: hypothetical protein L0Z73_19085 [Gammaproteobacteria bacterium]|nr:hypothetical protein [Gammaproteobacteria bacterium]